MITSALRACANAQSARISVISIIGFVGVSIYTAFVFGLKAAFTASRSEVPT